MSTLEKAIIVAARAHSGQTDKAGQPYILHPLRVMQSVRTPHARIVAVLHDVLEDSEISAEDLRREGFSPDIVEAVTALSREPGEDYLDFVRRAKKNPLAREVKLADVHDNMDMTRIKEPTSKDRERMRKYEAALHELNR
ncbi:GTP pyrophosphokinase [Paenibacillus chitinolyticus]|uniref:HD domain-containing protein n=1 Tax=Paenibacillus chitinolyticus TaxID=79263 RepID=UPI002DBAB1B9|nr:HD domain-containing protein [Paenibacillus chitinolyticus]MEC0248919.1 GTP pyrophosphokinase [Paenibacillus chitinolyticus]